jgi:tetratricopeptide (TPR) repeat protein
LAPDQFEVRLIQAEVFAHAVRTPALLAEAEKTIRALSAARPNDPELVRQLAEVLREQNRFDEAAQLFKSIGDFQVAAWSYFDGGKLRLALTSIKSAPRSVTALQLHAILEYTANEDLAAAQAVINQFEPSELLAEMPATTAIRIAMYRGDPERMIELAQGLEKDFLDSNAFRGPRRYFTGLAHQMAERPAQAESEWRAALAVVHQRLSAAPDDRELLMWAAWLHARLNEAPEAERLFARSQALAGLHGYTVRYMGINDSLLSVHVLISLRKRDEVLAGLGNMFREKPPGWELLHAEMRFGPESEFMREDPRFQKLLHDHLPEGAQPYPAAAATKPASTP